MAGVSASGESTFEHRGELVDWTAEFFEHLVTLLHRPVGGGAIAPLEMSGDE